MFVNVNKKTTQINHVSDSTNLLTFIHLLLAFPLLFDLLLLTQEVTALLLSKETGGGIIVQAFYAKMGVNLPLIATQANSADFVSSICPE